MDVSAAKARIQADVDALGPKLIETSHQIHLSPELYFQEHRAVELLCDVLINEGLSVERPVFGLETGFVARVGTGTGPTVAVLCEYDALPELGHACGHNIIAAAGLGAGIAAARLATDAGGKLLIMGTPAEEFGGGKVVMANAGAFEGVDAAMMIHPSDEETAEHLTLAIASWEVTYRGAAAHASVSPWQGRNALDAAVFGYNAIAALRQHIRPTERIHGVFKKAGEQPNIVPEISIAEWWIRSDTSESLQALNERVMQCLQAGALAAGCEMEHAVTCPDYYDMRTNAPLAEMYISNMEALGRQVGHADPAHGLGSTDMGNVSQLVPAIHPMIKISPPGIRIHTREFADWARGPAGDRAILDGAKALAMTIADLWLRPDALPRVRDAFANMPRSTSP